MPATPFPAAHGPYPLDLPPAPAKTVRLGLIGLGWVTNQCHLPSIRMLRNAGWPVEVAALCDVLPERLQAAAEAWPGAATTLDPRVLLARPDLDGVMILTHPNSSAQLLREALGQVRCLFVEKPVANTVNEIESCAAMAARRQAKVQVGYNRRYQPLSGPFGQQLKKLGPAPRWEIRFWRARRNEPGFYDDTLVHCLDFLLHHLGPLQATTVQTWPGADRGHVLDRGWRIELATVSAPLITAGVDIRPSVGRDLEDYTVLGDRNSVALQYPHLGTANGRASLDVYEEGHESTLHEARMTAEDWPRRCWYSGFLAQMAEFCLLSSGVKEQSSCDLQAACSVLRLRDEIIGLIHQKRNLEPTVPSG